MSRIGLRLGGTPAHESQLDHTRRIPWAVKEMMEEEKRQQDTLPFLRRAGLDSAEADGRPPPCIGICYYEKLKALEAREELTRHNEVLKEDCETEQCMDYKSGLDLKPGKTRSDHLEFPEDNLAEDKEDLVHSGSSASIHELGPGAGDEYIKNQQDEDSDEEEFNNNILNL
ncbi:uncharacterized protein LOC111696293 isoform X2 [Eurytemora carolleeae]|nr:uncharacterized protein LOC111696293 isoform X2 [Eurytemora carolleeae]|eukprot:XP_023321637.1 uncharacterized protein LOC111696293 isoform X2 [Eurytemora affinis]